MYIPIITKSRAYREQIEIQKQNKKIREENAIVREEALEINNKLNNIKRIIEVGEKNKLNYFYILDQIKKELDVAKQF